MDILEFGIKWVKQQGPCPRESQMPAGLCEGDHPITHSTCPPYPGGLQ